MTRSLGWSLGVLALCLVAPSLSCSNPAPFEIRYETEHFRIGTEFDYPLCGGDLADFDAQIDGLEELLSTTVETPITLYLWENLPTEYCGEGPMGCYGREDNVVHSTAYILDHELVHAVVGSFADPPPFFSEGAAEALHRHRLVNLHSPQPLANFERSTADVDYNSAGLFMRWLWQRYGAEPFVALLKDQRDPFEAFEAVYGLTAESAEAMFFDELPYSYPPLIDCEHLALPEVETETENGQWFESLELDCSRDDVRGGDGFQAIARLVTVSETGSYAVDFEGSAATINRCADEILETAPEDDDPAWGDVPPTNSSLRSGYVRAIEDGDGPDVLTLVPGRYMLTVADEPGATVSLSFEAANTP